MSSASSTSEQTEIDLIGILKRRKGFLALGIFLGVGAAALYFFLTPPVYRAEMEILVGQRSGSMAKGAGSSEVEGSQTEEDVLSTHIQLFTSRRILSAAIRSSNLKDLSSFRQIIREGGNTMEYLQDNLSVTKGGEGVARDAHTLKATYDDPSAEDCALVLRAVFDEYAAYLEEHFEGTSAEAVNLLTKLATENSDAVAAAEKELSDFMTSTDLLWDGNKTQNIYKDRLQKTEQSLSDLAESHSETVSRLEVIREFLKRSEGKEVSDLQRLSLLSEKEVGRLKLMFDVTKGDSASEAFQAEQPIRQEAARARYSEYLNLIMREKKLSEKFNEGHPSVVSIREQLQILQEFIGGNSATIEGKDSIERMAPEEMLATYVGLLEHDVAEGNKKRAELLRRSAEELQAAKLLEASEMKVASLRNELDRRQTVYEETQATLKELNFVRDYAGYSTDVIGDAEPQQKPVWPRPIILLALGLFVGGGLGFLMAVAADLADTTFTDPDDVSRTLGTPVFAHVPQFPTIRESKKKGLLPMAPTVYAFHKPRSPEAEVFRILRTSVLCSIKDSHTRILQVTSPQPGDGKSTAAANLAISFAQSGRKTLLIDADLRRPRIAELFRVKRVLGLAEVLAGDLEPADAVRETAQENLSVVPSGRRPGSPSELLGSLEFKDLLQVYGEQFDFVIIDTPPVLAVSDAAVVSESVDAVIMALRVVKHGRQAAVRTRQVLAEHNVPVLGIIVNGFGVDRNHYGYRNKADSNGYAYSTGGKYSSYYTDAEPEEADAENEAASV